MLDGRTFQAALADDGGRRYEGSFVDEVKDVAIHRALVGADTPGEAIERVREVLARHGEFGDFRAQPVVDARGEVIRTPIRTRLSEIDWDGARCEARLSALQQTAIMALLDDHEPTWIVAAEVEIADRATVEAALRELESLRLVRSIREESGEPGRETDDDNWWAVTDEGWDLLGLIKSPWYG
jgi:hypothetical protein